MKKPISMFFAAVGWILVAGIVVAIMTLWNWDPISFVTNTIGRIADFFLGWEWFRRLIGQG